MEDIFFSRIGLAFQHLLTAVELPAHIQTEVQALSTELQTFEGSINGLIDQRVQARLDQIDGAALGGLNEANAKITGLQDRVTALESGVEGLANELDPQAPTNPAPPADDTTAAADTATDSVAGGTGDDSVAGGTGDDSVAAADAASGTDAGSDAGTTSTSSKRKSSSN